MTMPENRAEWGLWLKGMAGVGLYVALFLSLILACSGCYCPNLLVWKGAVVVSGGDVVLDGTIEGTDISPSIPLIGKGMTNGVELAP